MDNKAVQAFLNYYGYAYPEKLVVDGAFGAKSITALNKFQRSFRLPVTQTLDIRTKNEIEAFEYSTDVASIIKLNTLHPSIRQEAKECIKYVNDNILTGRAKMRVVQALRTFKEQDGLYAQGRTKPGKKVTNAKGGQSIHNYGFAFDYCLVIDGKTISWDDKADLDRDTIADWTEAALYFVKNGWIWGGEWQGFVDKPHLEKAPKNWRMLLADYQAGKVFVENGLTYVKI